jgi:hypothetical protein
MDKRTVDILRHADNGRTSTAEAALFADVDKDGSGTISKEEFNAMYANIKEAILEEHNALSKSKKRTKMLCMAVTVMSIFMAILLGANGALTFYVVDMSKEMHTSNGQLVDREQNPMKTDTSSYGMDIFDIARSVAAAPDDESLQEVIQGMDNIVYEDSKQATIYTKVSTVAVMADFVRMETEDGATIVVSTTNDGNSAISTKAVGVVSFDGAGTAKIALPTALKDGTQADVSAEVKQICQDAGCDLAHCTGPIAPSPLHVKTVTCGSVSIWEWAGSGKMSDHVNARKLGWWKRAKRRVWGRKRWNRRDGQFGGR